MGLRRLALIAAIPCVAACGALLGATSDPPADGGATSGGDGAATPIDRAGGGDASFDGTSVDGGACAPASFCSDFDPPRDTWPFEWNPVLRGDAAFGAENASSTSAPNAFEVLTSTAKVAYVAIPVNALPLDVTFDVQILEVPVAVSPPDFHLLQLDGCDVKVKFDANANVKVQAGSDNGAYHAMDLEAWRTLRLNVTSAAATLDQIAPATTRLSAVAITKACSGAMHLRLGSNDVSDPNPYHWHFLVDHVRANWP